MEENFKSAGGKEEKNILRCYIFKKEEEGRKTM